jgi:phosphoglycerate dehydrogenase-like enzyme
MPAIEKLGIVADHVNRHPAMRQEVLNVCPAAKFHDSGHRLGEDELIAFLADCDAAIIGFEPVTERVLSALPNLRIISKYGNGCESFDFQAMQRHGVRFGDTWGVNRLAVAELTLGFMLMGLRWVMPLNVAMRAGERPALRNGRFLTGRVVGIHGCGHIGKEVTRLLAPFNCTILACDIKDYPDFYKQWNVTPVPTKSSWRARKSSRCICRKPSRRSASTHARYSPGCGPTPF